MKLIARLAMFLSFLIMVQYANAASNNVYVDQIGDGSTITFTQTGAGNNIGDSATHAGFTGSNNTVTVDQIGNQNTAALTVNGSGNNITSTTTGNNNTTSIQCNPCTTNTITDTVTGNGNVINHTNDSSASTSTVTVGSDNNTVNITNNSTNTSGAQSTVNISGGGGNNVDILQTDSAGANGHTVDLAIVGATNTATIHQGGTVDSNVQATITGSGNTLTVHSNTSM